MIWYDWFVPALIRLFVCRMWLRWWLQSQLRIGRGRKRRSLWLTKPLGWDFDIPSLDCDSAHLHVVVAVSQQSLAELGSSKPETCVLSCILFTCKSRLVYTKVKIQTCSGGKLCCHCHYKHVNVACSVSWSSVCLQCSHWCLHIATTQKACPFQNRLSLLWSLPAVAISQSLTRSSAHWHVVWSVIACRSETICVESLLPVSDFQAHDTLVASLAELAVAATRGARDVSIIRHIWSSVSKDAAQEQYHKEHSCNPCNKDVLLILLLTCCIFGNGRLT